MKSSLNDCCPKMIIASGQIKTSNHLVRYSDGYCITSRQIKLSNHLVLVEVVGCVCVLPLALLSWEGFVDPFVEVVEVELVDCVVDVMVGGVPPIRLFNTPSSMC